MLMGPDAVVYPEQCLVGFVFSELPLDLAGKLQILLLAYPKCWVTVNCGQLWVVQADTDQIVQCTEVLIASFLSSGIITAIVLNLPERKLAKHSSVQFINILLLKEL